jgi:tetratricopeptide (TPR) repeat protein
MLAACHLALDDYAHAADEYNLVLNSETTFRRFMLLDFVRAVVQEGGGEAELLKRIHDGDLSSFLNDFKPDLFKVLAKSRALSGERGKAEAVYRHWALEYPEDPQVHLHLAELFAQESNYEEAYKALRKAVDLKPELEQELPYKVALPLGAIAAEHRDLDRLTQQAIKEHPEFEEFFDLLFPDVWPTYGRMSDEARGVWRFASVQTYYNPSNQAALAPQYRQTGAEKLAKAVEIELRQCVFEAFKKETSGNRNVTAAAEQARKDSKAGRFAEFLVGRGKLTLGEMEFILCGARAGKGELFRLFGDWTHQHFPKLDGGQLEVLKKIRIPRNLESHESAPLDVKEVPKLCRRFLDALLARPAEKSLLSG